MNDLLRQKLAEIVARYGRTVGDDPRYCESLLRDLCGEHKPEIHALISAAKERVPADLLSSQTSKSPETQLARLTKRLQEDLALAEEAARWAVETWALALGVLTDSPPPPRRQTPARGSAETGPKVPRGAKQDRAGAGPRQPQSAARQSPQDPPPPSPPAGSPFRAPIASPAPAQDRPAPAQPEVSGWTLLVIIGLVIGVWACVKYWPGKSAPAAPAVEREPARGGLLPPSSADGEGYGEKDLHFRSESHEEIQVEKPFLLDQEGEPGTAEPPESSLPVDPVGPLPDPGPAPAPPG